MNTDELRANVDTIVVVLMENRSFDHIFGHLSLPQFGARQDVDGVRSLDDPNLGNRSSNGTIIQPFLDSDRVLPNDLPHEREFVKQQLAWAPLAGRFTMTGFVAAYEDFTKTSGTWSPPPMGLMTPNFIPVTTFFAREFLLCDRWFAPLPTSTQPNRLMATCGYTVNDSTQNGLLPNQRLVFDWLGDRGIRWRVYSAGLSFFTLMESVWARMLTDQFKRLPDLSHDIQNEADDAWPQVIFIEPDYDDSPVHLSGHACDNHPPVALAFGEAFLQQAYEALTLNPARWGRMVIIFTYDEHGGFFDHVPPRSIASPPPAGANYTTGFVSTGVRVPALVISPFVGRGAVSHNVLDHTSILQLIAERFGDGADGYSPAVDARKAAGIGSVSALLSAQSVQAPAPDSPAGSLVGTAMMQTTRTPQTASQLAFTTAIERFATAHGAEATAKFPELAHWMGSK